MVDASMRLSSGLEKGVIAAYNMSAASLFLGAKILASRGDSPKWTNAHVDEATERGVGFETSMIGDHLVMRLEPMQLYRDFVYAMARALGCEVSIVRGWPVLALGHQRISSAAVLQSAYGAARMANSLYDQMQSHRSAA